MHRFRNVLLLHDTSPEHELVLKRAVDLARRNQARLTVVDVIEEDSWDSGEIYNLAPFQEMKQLVIKERQKNLETAIGTQEREAWQSRVSARRCDCRHGRAAAGR